ncbi:MAG: oxygen-insensitive NADPH nitroreductase [Bacilli bacterium]|nr:oxygen-insensitive NADPH nitroreductase [Bacilli bacterium]
MEMIKLLKSHSTVRNYTDEKIPEALLHEFIKAGQHASSSHFVQAYSVIHVTDEAKKEELKKWADNHVQFDTAAAVLIFCADLKRNETAAKMHGEPFEGSTAENLLVSVIDAALFAQNVAVAAESEGYGICFIGGIRNNIREISELFELPDYVIPLFAMTIGVPAKRNEVKPRLPLEAVLHKDRYDASKYEALLKQYDEVMREYYQTRSSNQKDQKWTVGMAKFFRKPRREHMKQFIEEKRFFLK